MERRDFLKNSSNAIGLALLTGFVGFEFHNRETAVYPTHIFKSKSFEVATDEAFPALALARNENHTAALKASL